MKHRIALLMTISLLLCVVLMISCKLQLDISNPLPADRAMAPSFDLPAHDDASITLKGLVKGGSAVLVFYRGYW